MSRMSANYNLVKTAKYDHKSVFTHFQILLEIGAETMSLTMSGISHLIKLIVLVFIFGIFVTCEIFVTVY